jgi:hypothetical protein
MPVIERFRDLRDLNDLLRVVGFVLEDHLGDQVSVSRRGNGFDLEFAGAGPDADRFNVWLGLLRLDGNDDLRTIRRPLD